MKNILIAVLLLAPCAAAAEETAKAAPVAPATAVPAAPAPDAWKTRSFTAEELKKYDGKEGRPVYAAVDGIVYDLTRSKYWKGGSHMKMHSSGADLTKDIKERAPKGIHKGGKILEKMPKVGVLAAPPATAGETRPAAAVPGVSAHKIAPGELGREERCAVTRKPLKVTENTPALEYKGKVYYFSSLPLLDKFSKDPEKYLGELEKARGLLKKKA